MEDSVAYYFGSWSILRILHPALLCEFPESIGKTWCTGITVLIIRPLWSDVQSNYELNECRIIKVAQGYFVGVNLILWSGSEAT
jgi:hypothetical protein